MRSRLAMVLGGALLLALTSALVVRPAWLGFDDELDRMRDVPEAP